MSYRRIGKDKASQDLSEAETKRAALEAERAALRSEADQAQALAQTIACEKAIVENARRIVAEEAKALEMRRAALEDVEGIGRRELDAGKAELKTATEGLEREKEALKNARKVIKHENLEWCTWGLGLRAASSPLTFEIDMSSSLRDRHALFPLR